MEGRTSTSTSVRPSRAMSCFLQLQIPNPFHCIAVLVLLCTALTAALFIRRQCRRSSRTTTTSIPLTFQRLHEREPHNNKLVATLPLPILSPTALTFSLALRLEPTATTSKYSKNIIIGLFLENGLEQYIAIKSHVRLRPTPIPSE